MKKLALLLSMLVALGVGANVSAADTGVVFEGGAENFVFVPGSASWADVDLFAGLKNAMPGDVMTNEIEVRNDATEYDTVKIYLRAEPHDDTTNPPAVATESATTMNDFLAQLTMRVYNSGKLIYESSPDRSGALAEGVLLGEFAQGESTTLIVELEVPITLSSAYAHRSGEVDWIFTAENGVPETETITSSVAGSPDTGRYKGILGSVAADATAAVCVVLAAGGIYYWVRRRRQ